MDTNTVTTTPPLSPQAPVTDTSLRAQRIARMIDRLEPGTYVINLVKPAFRENSWMVELVQPVILKKQELSKEYTPRE